jgi:hypothetical protein
MIENEPAFPSPIYKQAISVGETLASNVAKQGKKP